MMAGVNRCTFIGNMTDDPKMKQGDSEDGSNDLCNFAIAVNKPPGRGGQESPPTYIDMVAWGKLAGQVDKYGRKGRLVYVEGELEVRKWEDRETQEKKKMYRIKAYVVRFLDRARDDDDDDRGRSRDDDRRSRRSRDDDDRRPRDDDRPARAPANRAEDFDDLPF